MNARGTSTYRYPSANGINTLTATRDAGIELYVDGALTHRFEEADVHVALTDVPDGVKDLADRIESAGGSAGDRAGLEVFLGDWQLEYRRW